MRIGTKLKCVKRCYGVFTEGKTYTVVLDPYGEALDPRIWVTTDSKDSPTYLMTIAHLKQYLMPMNSITCNLPNWF